MKRLLPLRLVPHPSLLGLPRLKAGLALPVQQLDLAALTPTHLIM